MSTAEIAAQTLITEIKRICRTFSIDFTTAPIRTTQRTVTGIVVKYMLEVYNAAGSHNTERAFASVLGRQGLTEHKTALGLMLWKDVPGGGFTMKVQIMFERDQNGNETTIHINVIAPD